jgi:hypothetical protein
VIEKSGIAESGIASSHVLMLFMRAAGGECSACVWRGGVGRRSGRLADAALGRGLDEGSRDRGGEVVVDEGRWEGVVEEGWERRLRRCMASLEAFSRM